jgi:hypothetical protein
MSVHRRIADLIPGHGEGQLMTPGRHSSHVLWSFLAYELSDGFDVLSRLNASPGWYPRHVQES